MRLKSGRRSGEQKLPVTLQLAPWRADRHLHRHPRRHRLGGEEGDGLGHARNLFALWGLSTPNFWLGILMIFLFRCTLAGCRLGLCAAGRRLEGKPCHHHHAGLCGHALAAF